MQHFPLTEKLHTDVLEEKYGPIHAQVLKHDSRVRESLLVDPKGVARTYALTFFEPWKNPEIPKIDGEIKSGEAIGKAFRKKGYAIRKNVLDVFKIKLPPWLKSDFQTSGNYAKARLSEFYAKKPGQDLVIYGVVTEVYAPDFRRPVINAVDRVQVSAPTECLEQTGFSREDIYRRIGDDNNYEDAQSRYKKAKQVAVHILRKLRKKVKQEIRSPDPRK